MEHRRAREISITPHDISSQQETEHPPINLTLIKQQDHEEWTKNMPSILRMVHGKMTLEEQRLGSYSFTREDYEDLSSNILLKAYSSAPCLRGNTSAEFYGWLSKIARNTVNDEVTKRNRRDHHYKIHYYIQIGLNWEDPLHLDPDENPVREEVESHLFNDEISKIFDTVLSVRQRMIIEMELDQIPQAEIANKMQMKLSAVKMTIKRAREKLSAILDEYRNEGENSAENNL